MGEKPVKYCRVTCMHCEGAGCIYCNKTGTVEVAEPPVKCRHCDGECCFYCGFTGWGGLRGKYD